MLEKRMSSIMEKIEKKGNVEVSELAEEFGVTEKTIRHDLDKMNKMGLLKRVHGGAVSNIKQAEDAYANTARTISLKGKELIAKAAFDYVRRFGTVGKIFFIDAGTTNYEFSRYLTNTSAIIVTNDLLIASKLSTSSCQLYLTGGALSNNVNKYLTGEDAVNMINTHSASISFVGASAISIEHGLMTMNDSDVSIKRAMIRNSNLKICLLDHSKFNITSFAKFADVSDIDLIITDYLEEEVIASFKKAGVEIIVASQEQ